MDSLEVLDKESCHFKDSEKVKFRLKMHCEEDVEKLSLRMMIHNNDQMVTATAVCPDFVRCEKGKEYEKIFEMDVSALANGIYKVLAVLFELNELGEVIDSDGAYPALVFEREKTTDILWKSKLYGDTALENIICVD